MTTVEPLDDEARERRRALIVRRWARYVRDRDHLDRFAPEDE